MILALMYVTNFCLRFLMPMTLAFLFYYFKYVANYRYNLAVTNPIVLCLVFVVVVLNANSAWTM